MLEKLLDLLKRNTWTVDKLCKELSQSKQEIEAQLCFLESINYIKKVPITLNCLKNCNGCSSGHMIKEKNIQYIWKLCEY